MSSTLWIVGRFSPIEWRILPKKNGENCKCSDHIENTLPNDYRKRKKLKNDKVENDSNDDEDDSDSDCNTSDDLNQNDNGVDDVDDNVNGMEANIGSDEDEVLLFQQANVHNCDIVDCDGFQETELLCSENSFTLNSSFWVYQFTNF